MKKAKVAIDQDGICKEFDSLCKKYKIQSAVLICENNLVKIDKQTSSATVMMAAHSINKKKEKELFSAIRQLFRVTHLNTKTLKVVADMVEEEAKRQEAIYKEKSLSKKDQAKLNKIRMQKNQCIQEKKYEEAANFRTEERKLLGIESSCIPLKIEVETLDSKPEIKELEDLTNTLLKNIEGWKKNK